MRDGIPTNSKTAIHWAHLEMLTRGLFCGSLNIENGDRLKYVGQYRNEAALNIEELMKIIDDIEEWRKLVNILKFARDRKKKMK